MKTQPTKEIDEQLDTILGDFAIENSGEDKVIMSIQAVESAKLALTNLYNKAREDEREEIVEWVKSLDYDLLRKEDFINYLTK